MGTKNRKAMIQSAAANKHEAKLKAAGFRTESSSPLEKVAAVILDEVGKDLDAELEVKTKLMEPPIETSASTGGQVEVPLEQKPVVPTATEVAKVEGTSDATGSADTASGGTTKGKVKTYLHKSTIAGPTKTVWHIADAMKKNNPNVRRKDVVEACIANGIATHTALTQYQRWFTAHKADKKPEVPVAAPAANS